MRLELATFLVDNAVFDRKTWYDRGTLSLNKEELLGSVSQDQRIVDADLEIVHPGEPARIIGIRDITEPRIKVEGPGCAFPGILGPAAVVGQGTTHRLSGIAVTVSAQFPSAIRAGASAPNASFLDMWGPGAAATRFSSCIHLVLCLNLAGDLTEMEYHETLQLAELKVGRSLAQTTVGMRPAEVEVFDLQPVRDNLPKVVYILGFRTNHLDFHPGISLYGLPLREPLPTLVHPNEFFDGAVTRDTRKGEAAYPYTCDWEHQPVIRELAREHGKSLNLIGIIFQSNHANTQTGKEITNARGAMMARILGAEAAIISRTHTSGNRFVDTMLITRYCEQHGIKTVLMTPEYGGRYGEDLPFLFTAPEADAIVSTGSIDRPLELPAPKRVVGPRGYTTYLLDVDRGPGRPPIPAAGPLSVETWGRTAIAGGIDWWGYGQFTCKED